MNVVNVTHIPQGTVTFIRLFNLTVLTGKV